MWKILLLERKLLNYTIPFQSAFLCTLFRNLKNIFIITKQHDIRVLQVLLQTRGRLRRIEKRLYLTRVKDDRSRQLRNDIQKDTRCWDETDRRQRDRCPRRIKWKILSRRVARVTGVEATESDGRSTCWEFRAGKRLLESTPSPPRCCGTSKGRREIVSESNSRWINTKSS